MTSLYEFFVRKLSFGVASWDRIRTARIPPSTKKKRAVTMYMIPIRLWSTVTSQLASRPSFQPTGYAASLLTATRRSLVDVRLHVGVEGVDLRRRPGDPDRRHRRAAPCVHAVLHRRRKARALRQDRVVPEVRPVAALRLHAVARRADALELGLAERLRLLRGRRDEGVVGRLRLGEHGRRHRLVVDAAELGALAAVGAGRVGLEPEVVDAARD